MVWDEDFKTLMWTQDYTIVIVNTQKIKKWGTKIFASINWREKRTADNTLSDETKSVSVSDDLRQRA